MESVYHIAPQPARSDAGGLRQPRATKPDARAKPQRAASATRERVIMVPTDANAHPTCKHCLVPVKLCHCSAGKAARAAACARCAELERELSAAQAASERRALEQAEAHAAERREAERRLAELQGEVAAAQAELAAAQAQLQGSEAREAGLAAQLAAAQATIPRIFPVHLLHLLHISPTSPRHLPYRGAGDDRGARCAACRGAGDDPRARCAAGRRAG